MTTDFVAIYSCEGSGGLAPHFPFTLHASLLFAWQH